MIWYVVVFINSLEKYVNTSMCQTLCWELETQSVHETPIPEGAFNLGGKKGE